MAKKKTDERRPCIYCARDKRTNKYYVGQTRYGLKHRQHQHLDRAYNKKRNTKFCRALRRYGQDNFEWETLYIVRNDDLSPEQLQSLLNMREKAWVKYFNSFENGYNQDEGGSGGVRYKYATLEEKNEAQKELHKTRRHNMKINSPEKYKQFLNKRRIDRKPRQDHYNEIRRVEYLKEHNPEQLERKRQQGKIRRINNENKNPELKEARLNKHKEYMKQRRKTAEYKQKAREAQRRYYAKLKQQQELQTES